MMLVTLLLCKGLHTTIFYYLRNEEIFIAQETLARRKNSFVAQTIAYNNFIILNLRDQKVRRERTLSATIDVIVTQN